MPIYEYQCDACGHHFEVIQRMSDSPLTDCPSCEAPKVRKLVSAAAFHLKGTGWYETDFKNKGKSEPRAAKSTDGKAEAKSESKDSKPATSDSKPAETASSKPKQAAD